MIKRSIQLQDRTVVNIYVLNEGTNIAPKYIKQTLMDMKGDKTVAQS